MCVSVIDNVVILLILMKAYNSYIMRYIYDSRDYLNNTTR